MRNCTWDDIFALRERMGKRCEVQYYNDGRYVAHTGDSAWLWNKELEKWVVATPDDMKPST